MMASKDMKTIKSQIIYESPLLKRGKYQNTFKEKWFVLLENHILVYYSSEEKAKLDNATCDGTILLKDVHNFTVLSNEPNKSQLLVPDSSYLRISEARKSSVIDQIRITNQPSQYKENNDNNEPYAMQLDTPQRSYIFGTKKSNEFKQWLFYLENMIFGGIIHSGYLFKIGGKWKSWKRRWFHLDKKLLLLKYYETDKLKIWKGSIDLSVVTNLCRGDKESNGKDFTIELNTNDRVWVLAANSEDNRTVWIDKLKNVIPKDKEYIMANIDTNMDEKEAVPTPKGVRFSMDANVPRRRGVTFSPTPMDTPITRSRSKCGFDYNLDDKFHEDSVRSVSSTEAELSDISKDHSVIIHDKEHHARFRTTISVRYALGEQDSEDSYYDSDESRTLASMASLDEYDGTLADDYGPLMNFGKYRQRSDHDMPFETEEFGRFGNSSQISVEKWNIDEVTPSPMRTPRDDEHKAEHIKQTQSKGYLFRGLKTQFINVHNVDLKIATIQEENSESSDSDESRSGTRVRRNTLSVYEEEKEAKRQHFKTKSVMRTVEFDERFRKIYRRKKKNIDISFAQKNMIKQWKQCMETNEDKLLNEWNTKCAEMTSDNCVRRIVVLLRFYHSWIYSSKHKQGISERLDKLQGFDSVLLMNDFYHIRRDYHDQSVYLKLFFLQQSSIQNVDIESCIMLLRCNRDKVKMSTDFLLRRSLYFLSSTKLKGSDETREVVLQQLLDSIYCFVFYSEYFTGNDSKSLCDTINVHQQKKKIRNILYKYNNEENVRLGNKFCSSIKYENELANTYGGNKNNIFGVNMRYGTRIEWYYLHEYRPYFGTMKEELMNHSQYEISVFQWNDIILKADVMKDTVLFKSSLLSKKANENERHLCDNTQIMDIHIIALVLYSHFNKLKKSLLDSYHILSAPPITDKTDKDKDDIQNYTRLKHFNFFYHFGRLLLEAVKVYGDNMYNNKNTLFSTFYHAVNINYQNVVSWNKFAYNTYGPISATTQPIVSFLYNDHHQSTILELDLNGGTLFSQYVYSIDLSCMSDCPYEGELLMDGGVSLGIRNVLSLKVYKNANDYYKWMESIFLLRIIVGDIYWKLNEAIQDYFVQNLCKNDMICSRLSLLIINEMEFDADDTDSSNDIPKHVRTLFHSYCDSMVGYCYVDYSRILYLPKELQHLFLVNEYECVNCKFLMELFPNINFIYGYNFIFDETFCKHIVTYLSNDKQKKNRLMYIQFEKFDRQQQINNNYFKEEVITVLEQYDNFSNKWNIKKSNKWKSIKFENQELINKFTIPINPVKIASKNKDSDKSKNTVKDQQQKPKIAK